MLESFYPYEYVESVFAIDYEKLYGLGYRGIIFDIDNTLVHHGDDSTPEVDELIASVQAIGFSVVLLTDNDEPRVKRFMRNIDCSYVCDAEKPQVDGFLQAVKLLGVPKEQVVCIGDQVFTDIRGSNRAGLASILVKFIQPEGETKIGKKRRLEKALLRTYGLRDGYLNRIGDIHKEGAPKPLLWQRGMNFCDMGPTAYAISLRKEIVKRHVQNLIDPNLFAVARHRELLPTVVSDHSSGLIKRGPGIDPQLQYNKADNIALACQRLDQLVVRPGEIFSFWRIVGNTTRRKGYKEGREIIGDQIEAGLGGGLCNLGNTINWLILHSPLEIVEFHSHSDALAPDGPKRIPFSTGTSVSFNNVDYRFKNVTDQNVQLHLWCADEMLHAELRSERPFPWRYELVEEGHHFRKEDGKYYRVSKIYRETTDAETGELVERKLVLDNHSEVMFDYSLIPPDQIRE